MLGLGSNIGDRLSNIHWAFSNLCKISTNSTLSSEFEYPALLPNDSPSEWNMPFLNAVAALHTDLTYSDLFNYIKGVEIKLGRNVNAQKWSPRVIDIDILLFKNLIINETNIIIPHPLMHTRLFVLEPLCDILPEIVHPVLQITAQNLLQDFRQFITHS